MKLFTTIMAMGGALASAMPESFGSSILPNHVDQSTYANFGEVASQHLNLDFEVDFNKKEFIGSVDHTLRAMQDNLKRVILDYGGIDIGKVQISYKTKHYENVPFKLHTDMNQNLGNALEVELPESLSLKEGDTFNMIVFYNTNEKTLAINWLKPSQTAGKKLPYLFTQCESIACRTVAPMMDTPAIKITYSANVTVESDFVVKMSANATGIEDHANGQKSYLFNNAIRMPSYLIAIAVGDLEYRELGPRVGVITEPSQMDRVANELESLQSLLDETELYLTPYIWGNYSILILPPSFPFGGMENPLLTFASPTIIAGDKSQVYVATHEIAHSWTGNAVTCRNWEHFWLNEGFTVFEERKVSAKLHGREFAMVEALLGNSSMYTDMRNYLAANQTTFASLHPTLKGASPDEAFSTIPYDKGFQLLYYLETLVGEELFQTFLRQYILAFSETSVVTDDLRFSWEDFVEDHFDADETNRIIGEVDWDAWIYQAGLPPVHLDFTTKASNESSDLADAYIQLEGKSSPENYKIFGDYYSNLKVIFLERLATQMDTVTLDIMSKVDADLNLTMTVDPECKQRWYPLAIRKGYESALEPAHEFISSQGRLKYLTPIYLALKQTGQKDLAIQWFNENIEFYHPLAIASLKKLLGLDKEPTYFAQVVDSVVSFIV